MIRYLSLLAILLWCVGDPIRDLFWGHPVFHPGVPWDYWHLCKMAHVYPVFACLLWWMWPLWARSSLLKRAGYNPSRRFFWHNGLYWALTGAASLAIWRSVIALAGGW